MSTQNKYDKIELLGVEIDAVSGEQAIAEIISLARDPTSPSAYIVKPYVEFIDTAATRPELRKLLNGAYLALADGIALVWASSFLYAGKRTFLRLWKTLFQIVLRPSELFWPLSKPLAGINFTWPLLEAAAAANLRIYFVGTESSEAIARVVTKVTSDIPSINIVGHRDGRDNSTERGEVSKAWIAELAGELRSTQADLVLVGMGFPLQEGITSVLAMHLDHGILIGEGGTFDYERFGGTMKKAPEWIQRLWLEWLWRLILEPRRLRRQLAIPRFIWRIWRSR